MIDLKSILSDFGHFKYNPEPPTHLSYYSNAPGMEYHPEPFLISSETKPGYCALWFTWRTEDGSVHKFGLIWKQKRR